MLTPPLRTGALKSDLFSLQIHQSHTDMSISKQAVGTWKGTVFYVLVYLSMGEVYLSPGFIPGHSHPVCCHLPSGVIFSHSYVMANTLWLLLSAVASTISKYQRSWRCTRVLGILCFGGKLQLRISLVSFHVSFTQS